VTRVFITGIGTVSCLGNDWPTVRANLLKGKCGLEQLERIDTTDLNVTIGGEVKGLDPRRIEVSDRISFRKLDWSSRFAVHAAHEAIEDAGLKGQVDGRRTAVILGAGLSGMDTLQTQTEKLLDRGPRRVSPFTIPMLMPNASPANVALAFGLSGPAYTTSSACSSSAHAMIDAFEMIRRGETDVVLTGGTESSMTRLGIASFCKMGAMSNRYNDCPHRSVRPFDADRAGLIMAEGSGILVFESEAHAQARGASIYAEFCGYGSTTDVYHIVQPDPEAVQATRALQQLFNRTGWVPSEIAGSTYINAHGTATELNDAMETLALKQAFGPAADKLQISSTKSMTGHMIGASGGIEMIATVLALRFGVLPPTINCETPDPRCDLDYIPNESRECTVDFAINNSFGFGGHNVCLGLKRVE
jgi:3-oxoacyl-[acyl-carrier-protein] synthase II